MGQRSTPLVRLMLMALLALAGATTAFAQITAATLSGTINDQTGAVLPGATVEVKNLDTGLTRSVVSNGNGLFVVPGLPPGRYEIKGTLDGFSSAVQSGIVLSVGQQAALTLMLKVGAAGTETTRVADVVCVSEPSVPEIVKL